jgi:hypothetical protein
MMMMGKRVVTGTSLLVLTIACALLSPAGAAAISSAEIVQRVSQQREANGIPGGLTERADWSADCAKHDYYEAQTGELEHSEDPGSPYYSAEGNWAAENSVLASGSSWNQGNPWEEAPIHLIQMLAPQLSEMGAAENDDHNCATTWPGYNRPEPASLVAYSYPGNGVTGVVPTERASESPLVPGDQVGLPEGTATGRYLLVYLSGVEPSDTPDVTATATLSEGSGPVDLRVVDSTNEEVGGYMPQPSAFLIPAQPLKPLSAYQADVRWSMEGTQLFDQRFSFTTGTNPGEAVVPIKKKRSSRCSRYSRQARLLRRRAAKARLHGGHMLRIASSVSQRRQGSHLLGRSRQLKRRARHRSKQFRHCLANLRSS